MSKPECRDRAPIVDDREAFITWSSYRGEKGMTVAQLKNGHKVGAVVLAYMVENHVRDVIENLPCSIDRIYVVDDASPDKTGEIVRALNLPRVQLIRHETNRGPGAALLTGYQAALKDDMDIVVKVDGDGQMPLDRTEDLIVPIMEGKADYTKGDRLSIPRHRQAMPRFRLFGNLMLTWLTRVASGYWHINDSQNGFTAISRKALEIDGLKLYPYYGYLNDLLVNLNVHGLKVLDVPMPARYGDEKSCIKLRSFVPRVSVFLLRRFIWRFRMKYIRRQRTISVCVEVPRCNIGGVQQMNDQSLSTLSGGDASR